MDLIGSEKQFEASSMKMKGRLEIRTGWFSRLSSPLAVVA